MRNDPIERTSKGMAPASPGLVMLSGPLLSRDTVASRWRRVTGGVK